MREEDTRPSDCTLILAHTLTPSLYQVARQWSDRRPPVSLMQTRFIMIIFPLLSPPPSCVRLQRLTSFCILIHRIIHYLPVSRQPVTLRLPSYECDSLTQSCTLRFQSSFPAALSLSLLLLYANIISLDPKAILVVSSFLSQDSSDKIAKVVATATRHSIAQEQRLVAD